MDGCEGPSEKQVPEHGSEGEQSESQSPLVLLCLLGKENEPNTHCDTLSVSVEESPGRMISLYQPWLHGYHAVHDCRKDRVRRAACLFAFDLAVACAWSGGGMLDLSVEECRRHNYTNHSTMKTKSWLISQ